MNERNLRGAGRKKGIRSTKQYWTDPQTHEVISTMVKVRKEDKLTDEKLNEILKTLTE